MNSLTPAFLTICRLNLRAMTVTNAAAYERNGCWMTKAGSLTGRAESCERLKKDYPARPSTVIAPTPTPRACSREEFEGRKDWRFYLPTQTREMRNDEYTNC